MNKFFQRERDAVYLMALLLALLAGGCLRIWGLADQVWSDDEWHGFYYVLGKSPGWLLTHFSIPGATCIPLNFYTWLLGACGLGSETLLRLPSLIGGVLCVIACPVLAAKIIGPRRAAWLALLLATAPILIFYSRVGRPYSAVALLGFAAILLAARWLQTGGLRPALFYAATGVLAVYFHLFAVVTVAAPALVALGFHLHAYCRKQPQATTPPTVRHWLLVAAGMSVVGAILILPALIHSLQSTFFTIALKGTLKLQSLPHLATLISGTASPALVILFWLLLIIGAVDQCRRRLQFGILLVSLFPLHALALMLSRPDASQSAIVLARYCLPLVPVSLLLVACGLQTVLEFLTTRLALRPALQVVLASGFIVALTVAGPLPQCYVAPNNFTNHGAYQHDYSPIRWQRSFYSDLTPADFPLVTTIRVDEVSPFYAQLAEAANQRAVVEYPMLIGDHFNPLYYYQHFHRRPVLVGYTADVKMAQGLAAGNIFGNTYIDQVLSLVDQPSRWKFRNLVAMNDLAAMRERHVEYIILHKRFEAQLSLVTPPPPALEGLCREYQKLLGAPAYEDVNLIVFRL